MRNDFLQSESIYNRVDEIRKAKGWSIYELAKKANITENSIYKWRDKKSAPTLYLLESISDAFGISIINLLVNEEAIIALTEEQQNLIKSWNTLKDSQKRALLEIIKSYQIND